ncbi:MAG: hypothetical protein WA372_14100, partial [Candidatus Sulfotelmatobacter sp.]
MNTPRILRSLGQFFAAGVLCMSLTGVLNAKIETATNITDGEAMKSAKIERGEIVYVSGHDLVVKKDDGRLVHLANLPDSFKVNVDGQDLGIHELKPGMKLERTTITNITPRTVVNVESISGKVWYVNPPSTLILTLDNGENQKVTLPDDAKIAVNGELTDAWGLKKGMMVSATRVTESPETVISQETRLSATAPEAPAANKPILFAMVVPVVNPATPTLASE